MLDAVIVGGSFAGLAAAMPLVRARRRVLLIDAERPRNRFAPHSHGFLGQDGATPEAIRTTGLRELAIYPAFGLRQGTVTQIVREGDGFSVHVQSGDSVRARRIVLAIGVIDDLPPIEGLHERWGASVAACPYCHGYEMADRPLAVLATNPHSLDHAILLKEWSDDVVFITDVPPEADAADRLAQRRVETAVGQILRLEGEGRELSTIVLADGRRLPREGLFLQTRYHLAGDLAGRLGVEIEEGPFGPIIVVSPFGATSVDGVFAAGDAVSPMASATLALASGTRAGSGVHRSLVGL